MFSILKEIRKQKFNKRACDKNGRSDFAAKIELNNVVRGSQEEKALRSSHLPLLDWRYQQHRG